MSVKRDFYREYLKARRSDPGVVGLFQKLRLIYKKTGGSVEFEDRNLLEEFSRRTGIPLEDVCYMVGEFVYHENNLEEIKRQREEEYLSVTRHEE